MQEYHKYNEQTDTSTDDATDALFRGFILAVCVIYILQAVAIAIVTH